MIEIPYWWDQKLPSLEATIYTHKPDFFSIVPSGKPIPTYKPSINSKLNKIRQNNQIPHLILATDWENSMDPSGW